MTDFSGYENSIQSQIPEIPKIPDTPLSRFGLDLAERILAGKGLRSEDLEKLANCNPANALELCQGAFVLRRHFFGSSVHLCSILNAKSGRCSENCSFCAQSSAYPAKSEVYPLLAENELKKSARSVSKFPVHRFSFVTSGRTLSRAEIKRVVEATAGVDKPCFCASLGILDKQDFAELRKGNISRYHHNLETAASFFSKICTSHSFDERLQTLLLARKAGFSLCSGGIFGLGESDTQVVELALQLRDLEVDAVPVNFLLPIAGTPLAFAQNLTPLRCLKILAVLRYILPNKDILLCGGRKYNLAEMEKLAFWAGASGLMVGNYLTVKGQGVNKDLEFLHKLGLQIRGKNGGEECSSKEQTLFPTAVY